MRLRFHNEDTNCITLLEIKPQRRTIYYFNNLNNLNINKITLDFPYLLFLFEYRRVPSGYVYDGYYLNTNSLSIFFSDKKYHLLIAMLVLF